MVRLLIRLLAATAVLATAPAALATSIPPPQPGQIVFAGDSLSGSHEAKYPAQFMALLGAGWTWQSVAVAGQGSAAMLASASELAAVYDPAAETHLLSVWIGTNDGPALGLTTYANLVAYCRAARRQGFAVMIFTILPRTDSYGVAWGEAWTAGRSAFNTKVRGAWCGFADYLCDVASDTRLADAAMYADGAHLTVAGYGFAAEDAAEALLHPVRRVRRGRGWRAH